MPSRFDEGWDDADIDLDAEFSEGFLLEPRARPVTQTAGGFADVNADTEYSSARPPIPFLGTFVAAGALMNAHGRTKADSTTHLIAGDKPAVDVALSALLVRPVDGDRIVRLETGEMFEVSRYQPATVRRAWIFLTDITPRAQVAR